MNTIERDILHKEIELIQACITRMANNSFIIKGWYFTLIVVLSAWKFNNIVFYSVSILFLTLIFYCLNLQFYVYERRFRELYKSRLSLRLEKSDFITDLYCLDTKKENFNIHIYFKKYIWKNKTLLLNYFGVMLVLIFINFILSFNKSEDKITIVIDGLKTLLK